ncbi:hypothetical protein ACQU0X_26730 [Pseudovibrio ascidiaceicola]|uniref:hypothetical protein n=1 Tax=Pseudovibrio ascidiaceicola TaxID=285279 RepID=UPI003D36B73F
MKKRAIIGTVFFLTAISQFASGGYLIYSASDNQSVRDRQMAQLEKQCIASLKQVGRVFRSPDGQNVSLLVGNAKDPRKALSDASAISLICPMYQMVEACLGDDCSAGKSVTWALKLERIVR